MVLCGLVFNTHTTITAKKILTGHVKTIVCKTKTYTKICSTTRFYPIISMKHNNLPVTMNFVTELKEKNPLFLVFPIY